VNNFLLPRASCLAWFVFVYFWFPRSELAFVSFQPVESSWSIVKTNVVRTKYMILSKYSVLSENVMHDTSYKLQYITGAFLGNKCGAFEV